MNIIKIISTFIMLIMLNHLAVGQISIDYCNFTIDKYEEEAKKRIIKTSFYPLVKFYPLKNTPDQLYLTPNIDISISKINKSHFLSLKIIFQKNNLTNYPGFLPDKAQMVIHHILGGNIILLNTSDCIGRRDKEGYLIYEPIFYIPRDDIKHILKSDINYISINWSNDSQTYEVYEVDVLRQLINCTNNK